MCQVRTPVQRLRTVAVVIVVAWVFGVHQGHDGAVGENNGRVQELICGKVCLNVVVVVIIAVVVVVIAKLSSSKPAHTFTTKQTTVHWHVKYNTKHVILLMAGSLSQKAPVLNHRQAVTYRDSGRLSCCRQPSNCG